MQVYSQISDRVCRSISKQLTSTPSGSNRWVLCQILNSRMSLKLQCWFYKSQIMFGKVKSSWYFTWKHVYSNSSHGLFFSLSCYWPCLPWLWEGSLDLCWQSLTVGEKYIPGGRTAFNKKHGIRLHLTHSTLGLPPLCFVPTLDQRVVWRLAEVKCYQTLQPSYAGAENKIPARCMLEPRLLRRAGETYQGSGE